MRRALIWWSGWAAAAAFYSLSADLMGKRHYLRYVEHHWVTPWITGPAALVCAAFGLVGLVAAHRADFGD